SDQKLGTHLYVCGPAGLIETVLGLAADRGWPEERCHAERFGELALDEGLPFTVHLARSGRSFDVAAGTSLLDRLSDLGIEWPALCRRGVCGECRMEGVQGALLHRDLYLSPAERAGGACLMPCVSRADGVLTPCRSGASSSRRFWRTCRPTSCSTRGSSP
ncbi:MAG: 2Fe-2S iron-sulfur cluster binding domain-containing protein, partial [Oxalobacteraceae bacterium]